MRVLVLGRVRVCVRVRVRVCGSTLAHHIYIHTHIQTYRGTLPRPTVTPPDYRYPLQLSKVSEYTFWKNPLLLFPSILLKIVCLCIYDGEPAFDLKACDKLMKQLRVLEEPIALVSMYIASDCLHCILNNEGAFIYSLPRSLNLSNIPTCNFFNFQTRNIKGLKAYLIHSFDKSA